jgi:hypothetical protein
MSNGDGAATAAKAAPESAEAKRTAQPNETQLRWLQRGLEQPGGKLTLFDRIGQKVSEQTVRSCIRHGWAEPWFNNPIKPDWLVCRLTESGRTIAADAPLLADED